MKTQRLASRVALIAVAACVVSPVSAAPRPKRPAATRAAPDASATAVADAARTSFAAGLRAYRNKKYSEALAAFLQSYALTKNAAVLVNLGQTQLRLGNPLEAVRYFRQFLEEARDATPELRSRVTKSLNDARELLGSIEVSAPEGAEISVDGEVVGRTPLAAPIDVLPGKHEVTMSNTAGSKSEEVDVPIGTRRAIKLMPQVSSRPAPTAPKVEGEAAEAPGFLSPPEIVAPVYIAGAVGLIAFTTAIVLNGIRVNSDRNATTATEALVRNNKNPASCYDSSANDPTITSSCATIKESRRIDANTTYPFNASLWIGAGATVAALGWYFIAPKPDVSPSTASSRTTPRAMQVAPFVSPSTAGAAVLGTF